MDIVKFNVDMQKQVNDFFKKSFFCCGYTLFSKK